MEMENTLDGGSEAEFVGPIPALSIMVMLVDDQSMVGEAVRRLLATEPDIDFHYCMDPLDALRQAELIKPTVILQDLVMPQVDGLDLVKVFRATPTLANTPIIVLSTREDAEVKSQSFAAGANDYLVKLPDKIELIARLRYHSQAYLSQLQRDEAYRALRESQQNLLDSNTALKALNATLEETMSARDAEATARQVVLHALQESEERFRQLAQNVPQVFWLLSPDGSQVLYISPAYAKVWSRSETYLQKDGLNWLESVHPEDQEAVAAAFMGKCALGQYSEEFRLLREDGSIIWLKDSCFPILDENRSLYRLARISSDITHSKLAEVEVHEARKEADRANLAKSEFLSRMSHELRTPLNAILGFGQLLELDGLAEKSSGYVNQILKGGQHLLELINEVLEIARIESGHLAMSLEPVSLGEVLDQVTSLLTPLTAAAGITLESRLEAEEVQHVMADRQRLKQVLLNLLSNAVKYNRRGGNVCFSHALMQLPAADGLQSQEEVPGQMVKISITDTGPGLSREDLEKLFIPFERLQAGTTEVEGTGLGLAVSRKLVEAMGGRITVESTPGQGSTFSVELPWAPNPVVQADTNLGAADQEEGIVPLDGPRCVLYVEDNLSNLNLIKCLVARMQRVELVSCVEGGQALGLALRHRPRLILLDLHLPDMNGEEVLTQLQGNASTKDIPVVILSADATPKKVESLIARGILDYLTKPLDVKKFLRILDEVLRK